MKWTFYFDTGEIRGTTKAGTPVHAVPTAKHSLYITSDPAVADYLNHHASAVLVDFEGGASPSGLRSTRKGTR